jgi:hypothetical protein
LLEASLECSSCGLGRTIFSDDATIKSDLSRLARTKNVLHLGDKIVKLNLYPACPVKEGLNKYIRQSNLVSGDGLGAPDSNSAALPDEPYTRAFNNYRIVWDDKLKSGKDVWTDTGWRSPVGELLHDELCDG